MKDDDIERVLKSAGPRERPPLDIEHAAREQLRAQWRAVVLEGRRDRRRLAGLALAASLFAVAAAVWVAMPRFATTDEAIATIALATGDIEARSGGWRNRWEKVQAGQSLTRGQKLRTGPAARGALTLAGGLSARMDLGTRVTIAAPDRIVLKRGALYIDAGAGLAATAALDIVTPSGTVRHAGTQYEVRVLDSGVRLRVREGRVEWRSTSGAIEQSRVGEQLTIAADGHIERGVIPVYGDSWNWIATATPVIGIEGLSLSDFLDWAARETGRDVVYASPALAAEVAAIVIHGSIAGLTPEQALDAVLATTRVRAAIAGGSIVVDGKDPATPAAG